MTTFGIDLGTTNSCISYIDADGRPTIVKNSLGEPTTPSVVYFEGPNRVTVGQAAKDVAILAPHLAVQLIKREMGRPGKVFTYHKQTYTPEMISALILRDLARSAAEACGEAVRDVVITVPAHFGVAEREATRRAGECAGLTVLDLLPEPIAAALSYQDHLTERGASHVLVFDLGGGTFDTTVIKMDGRQISVVCTDGDKCLGGADWDQRIATHLLTEFTRQNPGLDPSADEQFMQDLAITAESVKRDLSSRSAIRRTMRFGGRAAQVELTREQLQELTADLMERVLAITRRTIEEARHRGAPDISEVVLVGGMTRTSAVADRLRDEFGLEVTWHEPDLAVARGAALFAMTTAARQAAGLSAGTGPGSAAGPDSAKAAEAAEQVAAKLGISRDRAEEMLSQQVATVVPRGLGVKVVDQNDPIFLASPGKARSYIVHLLPANTELPKTVGPVQVATGLDNQPAVDIEVWEQKPGVDSEELADNVCVGRGRLRSLMGLPAGSPIDLTFSMSETGLLTVHAADLGSGREVRFELQIGGMDQAAADEARAAVARHELSK